MHPYIQVMIVAWVFVAIWIFYVVLLYKNPLGIAFYSVFQTVVKDQAITRS